MDQSGPACVFDIRMRQDLYPVRRGEGGNLRLEANPERAANATKNLPDQISSASPQFRPLILRSYNGDFKVLVKVFSTILRLWLFI